MKTWYVDEASRAILDTIPSERLSDEDDGPFRDGFTITRINVPKASRGQGIASKLLKQCTADADSESVVLWLWIEPSDGLDYTQLQTFYERNGFVMRADGLMRREPR